MPSLKTIYVDTFLILVISTILIICDCHQDQNLGNGTENNSKPGFAKIDRAFSLLRSLRHITASSTTSEKPRVTRNYHVGMSSRINDQSGNTESRSSRNSLYRLRKRDVLCEPSVNSNRRNVVPRYRLRSSDRVV